MNHDHKAELLGTLVTGLCAEQGVDAPKTQDPEALWNMFRALVNARPPMPADALWLKHQDELLSGLIAESGKASIEDTDCSTLNPRMRLWKGDITRLDVDAIVNAANSQLLGCWAAGHPCIDNAIHTFAGVQLRLACAQIMDAAGHEEPTGSARITPAFNLPSNYVLHTVGPIANGHPTDQHRAQLADCYRSCLNLAHQYGLGSVAFCCISTGVFGFPQAEAAVIAVNTVHEWLNETGISMTVIFNVFTDQDATIYTRLLT